MTKYFYSFTLLLIIHASAFSQTPEETYLNAKIAFEKSDYNNCLRLLTACETALDGTNARIEALRAQAYLDLKDYIKAKVSYRAYMAYVSDAEKGSEAFMLMLEIGQEIDKQLLAQNEIIKKEEEEYRRNKIKESENLFNNTSNTINREAKKKSTENNEILFAKALNNRDEASLELYKEFGNKENMAAIDLELDKKKRPSAYIAEAVKKGDAYEVKYLLETGADVNTKSAGDYLVHLAIKAPNSLSVLSTLFNANPNKEARNNKGETPFLLACSTQNTSCVNYLVNEKVNIKAKDYEEKTSLYYAVHYKWYSLLDYIFANGINADEVVKFETMQTTPLFAACHIYQNIIMAEYLIQKGANPNRTVSDNWTPLTCAVYQKNKTMVESLLNKGANPNLPGPYSWTALHVAARNRDREMIEFLIGKGSKLNATDVWKRTPYKIVRERRFKELYTLLK